MTYTARFEALQRRSGQEMITASHCRNWRFSREAKELVDSARRLASRAYYSNDYVSQEKATLQMFQKAVGGNSSSNVPRGGAKP